MERRGGSLLGNSRPRAFLALGVFALCSAGYTAWYVHLDIPRLVARGAGIFFLGAACVMWGIYKPKQLYVLAIGIPLAVSGLLMPLLDFSWVAIFGAAIAVGAPAMAMLQLLQLRRHNALKALTGQCT